MTRFKALTIATVMGACFAAPAFADVVPVELEEMRHHRAELTVVGPSGAVNYSAQALEALGSYQMVTITPWREEEAVFEGALLTDVLAANGISDAARIIVTAENGYATEISAEAWKNWPILLATRVDGQPHSRRARGPIQFVLPMSDDPSVASGDWMPSWVWMASRIEVVE